MALTGSMTAATPASQDVLHALLRDLLPPQGAWSDEEYLWLTDRARRPIELADGHIELLPMPTYAHQVLLLVPVPGALRPRSGDPASRRRRDVGIADARPGWEVPGT